MFLLYGYECVSAFSDPFASKYLPD